MLNPVLSFTVDLFVNKPWRHMGFPVPAGPLMNKGVEGKEFNISSCCEVGLSFPIQVNPSSSS